MCVPYKNVCQEREVKVGLFERSKDAEKLEHRGTDRIDVLGRTADVSLSEEFFWEKHEEFLKELIEAHKQGNKICVWWRSDLGAHEDRFHYALLGIEEGVGREIPLPVFAEMMGFVPINPGESFR